jgi:hypothetical protein
MNAKCNKLRSLRTSSAATCAQHITRTRNRTPRITVYIELPAEWTPQTQSAGSSVLPHRVRRGAARRPSFPTAIGALNYEMGELREAAEFSWLLTQGLLFSRRPPFIHVNQGFRFELKEPHELRGGSAKLSSALLHIKIKRAEAIQCLGKQIWEILMSPSNVDLLCAQP